jgi:uncharacterized membrane protein
MIRVGFRILLAIFYFGAGILHLASPRGFLAITPDWVPFPHFIIAFTGIAEIAGAVGLLIPQLRKWAGIGLALYALCVWPANFNHAINGISVGGEAWADGIMGLGWLFNPCSSGLRFGSDR